jgi:hypothetical protein
VDRDVPGAPSRWEAVTSAIRSFVNSAEATDARVGLQFFGLGRPPDDCGVDKYAAPAVAIAPLASNRAALLDAIGTTLPGSFTPTAPALEGVLRYSLGVAQRPENAGIPSVVVMASDGVPTECGPVGPDGLRTISFAQIVDILHSYSKPEENAATAMQPPIRTYIVGTQALSSNANVLAQAGDGQAFLVGNQAALASIWRRSSWTPCCGSWSSRSAAPSSCHSRRRGRAVARLRQGARALHRIEQSDRHGIPAHR